MIKRMCLYNLLLLGMLFPITRAANVPMPALLIPVGESVRAAGGGGPVYRLNEDVHAPGGRRLTGARLALPLMKGPPTEVEIVWHERSPEHGVQLAGRAGGRPDLNMTLVVVGDAVAGTINLLHEGVYELSGTVDDVTVSARDPLAAGPCGGGIPLPSSLQAQSRAHEPAYAPQSTSGTVTVDVMVVYTFNARQAALGTAAMQAAIANAILQANTVFSNSQINAAYRLVYTGEVNYPDSGDLFTDLNRLTNQGDNFLDEIHCIRDRYGADLVSLVVNNGGMLGGLAWIICNPAEFIPGRGFSVVVRNQLGNYVLAHEFGHNFGCDHDRENPSLCRAHDYSYGYRFTNDMFTNKTVMSYDPGFTVGHFSNPNVSFFGTPTGVAPPSPQSADNASTITGTMAMVASYRASLANPQLLPPPTPPGVAAMPVHTNAIRVTWSLACEATGYVVRRHGAIIGVTTNLFFNDTGLITLSNYCYTVVATNAAGSSPMSVSVCATPPTMPPFIMDGFADHPGYLLSNPGMTIYAAVRSNQLYVATWSSGIYPGDNNRNDHFILISDQLLASASAPAPWAKSGMVAVATTKPYLGAESTNEFVGWFNVSGESAARKHPDNSRQMEGVFDLTQTFGAMPDTIYIAAAAYQTPDNGLLVSQAPAGSGPNIDPGEFLIVAIPAIIDRNADGLYDRLDPAFDFVAHDVVSTVNGQISITWASVPGKTYRIERDTAPGSTIWPVVQTVTGPAGQAFATWTDVMPPSTSAAYRVWHLP